MAFTFNRIQDLTSTKRVEGLSLGGSVRLRYGTAVNDLSKDGAFADNSDNSLVTEKAIKTYVDAAVGVEDLWDRDSTNSYTYLKNTDNVGIGTSTPAQKLVVDGNILQTDGDYLATDQVRAINGDGLKLYDDGSNGIFVEDGGQVGIGTTSPDKELHVYGTIRTSTNDHNISFASGSNTLKYSLGLYGGNDLLIKDSSNNVHMSILNDSGNVGIGDTDPPAKLNVWGDIRTEEASGGDALIKLTYSNDDGVLKVYQNNSTAIQLHCNGDSYLKDLYDKQNIGDTNIGRFDLFGKGAGAAGLLEEQRQTDLASQRLKSEGDVAHSFSQLWG